MPAPKMLIFPTSSDNDHWPERPIYACLLLTKALFHELNECVSAAAVAKMMNSRVASVDFDGGDDESEKNIMPLLFYGMNTTEISRLKRFNTEQSIRTVQVWESIMPALDEGQVLLDSVNESPVRAVDNVPMITREIRVMGNQITWIWGYDTASGYLESVTIALNKIKFYYNLPQPRYQGFVVVDNPWIA